MSWQDALDFAAGMGGVNLGQIRAQQERLRLQAEAERRQQELAVFEMAQRQAEIEELNRKAEGEAAEVYGRTGLRKDETFSDLTQFTAAQSPEEVRAAMAKVPGAKLSNLETLAPGADRSRPGVYLNQPAQSAMEANASLLQEEADQKLFRDIAGKEAEAANQKRTLDLRQSELDLSGERFAYDKGPGRAPTEYQRKQMERIDADLGRLGQEGKGKISTGQAMGIAWSILGDEIDSDDTSEMYKVTELAHQIEGYYNSRGSAVARQVLEENVARFEARRKGFTDTELEDSGSGNLPDAIEKSFQQSGEVQRGQPAGKLPEVLSQPHMPAIEGEQDERWMQKLPNGDWEVPLRDLIGGNPQVNKMIQRNEMNADGKRLETQARHLASLGIPEDEFTEDIKAFLEAIRNPESVQGLMQQ